MATKTEEMQNEIIQRLRRQIRALRENLDTMEEENSRLQSDKDMLITWLYDALKESGHPLVYRHDTKVRDETAFEIGENCGGDLIIRIRA